MTDHLSLERLNQLTQAQAEAELRACCASHRWAAALASGRPYATNTALYAAAEQAGVAGASAETLAVLAEANRAYEERFGRVFLICASGRAADEMLASLRGRLNNDAETELRIAAGEQSKITRLRLERLLR